MHRVSAFEMRHVEGKKLAYFGTYLSLKISVEAIKKLKANTSVGQILY